MKQSRYHTPFARHTALLPTILIILTAALLAACSDTTADSSPAAPTTARESTAETSATEPSASEPSASEASPTVALPTVTPAPATDGNIAPVVFSPEAHQVELIPVAENLDRPVYLTHAGDGSERIFVVEKVGTIRILQSGNISPTPFLDISDRVGSSGNEQGLLGLAFAPNYATTGHFFVNYTDKSGDTVISRFEVSPDNPDAADPASEFLVMQLDQPARNHNGGMVAFGPDGYLYIGTGDGGAANDMFGNGQNPETLLGKMLRLDVTSDTSVPYTVPADNPWIDATWNGADVRDEVWAVGLRNPWRYSFDRATGDLWIGDVGQNQYEEINVTLATTPGKLNYGWPLMEGNHCFGLFSGDNCEQDGLELPVVEYDHAGHCSVTGGYVYRGSQFPALNGVYFFGDFCSGVIWATWQNEAGEWATAEVIQSDVSLSSFGEDEAGELYLTDLSRGTIHQLGVVP